MHSIPFFYSIVGGSELKVNFGPQRKSAVRQGENRDFLISEPNY